MKRSMQSSPSVDHRCAVKRPADLSTSTSGLAVGTGNTEKYNLVCDNHGVEVVEQRLEMGTKESSVKTNMVNFPSEELISDIFDDVDTKHDDSLYLQEVTAAIVKLWPEFNDDPTIEIAFKAADINGGGTIQRTEFPLLCRFLYFFKTLGGKIQTGSQPSSDAPLNKDMLAVATAEFPIVNVEKAFLELDIHNQGFVSFHDVCLWAAMQETRKIPSAGSCSAFANSTSSKLLAAELEALGDKGHSYVNRIFLRLRCSIDVLQAEVSDNNIEKCAIIIHECLSMETRKLLTVERHFDQMEMADPIQMIALQFYGLVYYGVDKVPCVLSPILDGVFKEEEDGTIRITLGRELTQCPAISMVMSIFDIKVGTRISPRRPFDRFLSSIVAVCLLKDTLDLKDLTMVVVCLFGSSIIFKLQEIRAVIASQRAVLDSTGQGRLYEQFEHMLTKDAVVNGLFDRLSNSNKTFQLGMTEAELVRAVQRAADTCNRIFGFLFSDKAEDSIGNLWSILPEICPAMRQRKLSTTFDYHQGVKLLESMTQNLKTPERTIVGFRGTPTTTEIAAMVHRGEHNFKTGYAYIKAKTVSLSITAAFAELTGGDTPISYFVGDLPMDCICRSIQIGDYLEAPATDPGHCDMNVYNMLQNGPKGSSWDVRSSPIGAFVYGKLGDVGLEKVLKHTGFPMNKDRARTLLEVVPDDTVIPIGETISRISVGRSVEIEKLLDEIRMKSNCEPLTSN